MTQSRNAAPQGAGSRGAGSRGAAVLWLVVTTVFGLLGTWIGLVAATHTVAEIGAGRGGLTDGLTLAFHLGLLLCPLGGWAMLWLRRYRLAMIVAAPPLLAWLALLAWSAIT